MNVRLNERRFQILQPACTVTHQDHEAAEVTDLQRLLLTPAPLLDSELFPQGTSFENFSPCPGWKAKVPGSFLLASTEAKG